MFRMRAKTAAVATAMALGAAGVTLPAAFAGDEARPEPRAAGPLPDADRESRAAGGMPPAIREALAKTVVVRAALTDLHALGGLLRRECGVDFMVPMHRDPPRVRLPVGEHAVRTVIEAAADSAALDVDYRAADGRPAACFWLRPRPEEWEQLRKQAASADATDRSLAARWLPWLGTKDGLVEALRLLGDPDRRVRLHAAHALCKHWLSGFGQVQVEVLRELAPAGTAQAVAEELHRLAQEHRTSSAGRPRHWFMRLAAALRDPVALPPLERFARYEMVEREKLLEGSTIDGALQAIVAIGGEEAERIMWDLAGKRRDDNAPAFMPRAFVAFGSRGNAAARDLVRAGLQGAYEQKGMPATAFAAVLRTVRPGPEGLWLVDPILELWERNDEPAGLPGEPARRAFEAAAACVLLRTGTPRGMAKIKERIDQETDDAARMDLCWQLWSEGLDGKAEAEWLRPRVENLVKADDDRVRQTAVGMLGFMASERSLPVLLELTRPGIDRHLQARAVRGLAAIGTEPAVNRVMECLRDPDVDLRAAAAQFCGECGHTSAAPTLRALLEDEDTRVRALAAQSLGKLLDVESLDALIAASRRGGERVDPQTGRKSPDPYRAAPVASLQLGVIGGPRAAAELAAAAKAGRDGAFDALVRSRAPDCGRALRGLLASDGAASLQRLAASGPHDVQRWAFAPAARQLIPVVIDVLSSPEPPVRRTAAGWLSTLGVDPRAVTALAALANDDPDETVRAAAVTALHGSWDAIADPAAAEVLLAAHRRRRDAADPAKQVDPMPALMDMGACGGPRVMIEIRRHLERTAPAVKAP